MKAPRPPIAPPTRWLSDWQVQVRVWVERGGEAVLGEGRADLLAAIDRTRSISAAARAVGMSYRHAWKLVQEVNRAAGEPLVEAAVGGHQGGGAQLTERGKLAIDIFQRLHHEVRAAAAIMLERTLAPQDARPTLHVSAAISLQEVVGQLLTEFALVRPGIAVRAVFGASNELADHALSGAPCDVFVSAGRDQLNRLELAGLTSPRERIQLAANGLVVVAPRDARLVLRKLEDLQSPRINCIAIADAAVPLGRAWKNHLEAKGCYEAIAAKSVQVDNSRGVLSAMASGRAQVALAFASDAANAPHCRILFTVPPRAASIEYWAAPLVSSPRIAEARRWIEFVASPLARRAFHRCGLSAVGAVKKPRRGKKSSR